MHGGAENIVLFLHNRSEMAADANGYRYPVFFFAINRDARLHHDCSTHRIVDRFEGRHDLITDRFDDGALILVRRLLHDVEA